ncbi:hypothetical protein SAMN05446037_100326 [Anaerovirgula multivorans]|uniref:Uncharacterized protein n=1 Tax=Anaerovirgula multivorans TaxID=312168 RepID=A0A239B6J3_9FIRM|nr:hypothetical protein [Anaerovirgula multivorans]SNS03241.1 hypothetical protein SAMN05446037_100326 [Anaerovirgula multivorans]
MNNEEKILSMMEAVDKLEQDQTRLETEVQEIKSNIIYIKKELHYIWSGIRKLDNQTS